jgi:hypothetical protein
VEKLGEVAGLDHRKGKAENGKIDKAKKREGAKTSKGEN